MKERVGWEDVKVKEIAEYFRGISYKKEQGSNKPLNNYKPILRANNIDNSLIFNDFIYVPNHLIKKEQFVKKGDIIFAMSSGSKHLVGKSAHAKNDFDGSFGTFCGLLRPSQLISKEYLAFIFQGNNYRKLISNVSTGTNINNLKKEHILDFILPLPPLLEQRAIVSKIEQLFSELDNGIANLKQAQEQLKVYRQALLAKTSVTEKFVPILQVVEDLSQGWSPKCHNHSRVNSNEWAVIKTTSIQEGYFDEKENKKLPDDLSPRIKHELKIGDILITRAGPRVRVGVCCLIKKVKPRLLNCDKAYRIRLKKDCIIPEFFEFTMNSPRYKFIIEELKTGISDSGVNLTQKGFLAIDIPVPPIQEQQAIVTEIETRLSVCDKLEQDISDSLEKAEALRQSILKQAFEGKLLNEQELTAVRSDPEWEPAEALLAKIKSKTT